MFKFKKISIFMAIIMVVSFAFTACTPAQEEPSSSGLSESESTDTADDEENAEPLKIVTTTFPIYDWVRNIVGDSENIEVSILIDNGVDLHSYQATSQDVAEIANADMFVYNGGDSDVWVEEVLASQDMQNIQVVNLMDELGDGVKMEEYVEGMQESEHAHDHEEDEHDHAEEDEHDHAEEDEHDHAEDEHDHAEEDEHDHAEDEHDHDEEATGHADEHIWLSLRNAQNLCEALVEEIRAIDPTNATMYSDNAEKYIAELGDLDTIFENELSALENDILMVVDRFPFRYLVDDYDISYYAAFPGCSAETEASFETVVFLSEKITELTLGKVVILENSSEDIASTIIQTSGQQNVEIVTLNSMQSITAEQIESGVTYMSIMDTNLVALKNALS